MSKPLERDERVVIIGGGFAGLYAALYLARRNYTVTLLSEDAYLLYTPLLPGVVGSTLEPRHVVVALRDVLPEGVVKLGRVEEISEQSVLFRARSGAEEEIEFDKLIVCAGAVPHRPPLAGINNALSLKTVADAVALRNRIISLLEQAEAIDNPDQRQATLTLAVVGAGYAGMEGVAEMQDFAHSLLDKYPRAKETGLRFLLIEARERLLPEVPEDVADYAGDQLRGRGIEICLGAKLEKINKRSIVLQQAGQEKAERVPCATVVWTAGVRPAQIESSLPLSEQGQIVCLPSGRVEGYEDIFAAGDVAAFPDPDGGLCPGTAQHAWRQGRHIAKQLVAGEDNAFDYRTKGLFVDLGQRKAVARMGRFYLQGLPAWWLARTYYLVMMPTAKRKLRLVADWTVALFFGRDSAAPELAGPEYWRPPLP